jgi:hypothetical protein
LTQILISRLQILISRLIRDYDESQIKEWIELNKTIIRDAWKTEAPFKWGDRLFLELMAVVSRVVEIHKEWPPPGPRNVQLIATCTFLDSVAGLVMQKREAENQAKRGTSSSNPNRFTWIGDKSESKF